MTLDEAIADNLRIAEGQDKCAEISASEHAKERIKVCAAEHRQLAEWLRELKALRSTLELCKKCQYVSECPINYPWLKEG